MRQNIIGYDTYDEAVADIENLAANQVVYVAETSRIYKLGDQELVPITNGASFELNGTTLNITF